ncbi:hypothetical protein BGHDH14_bgh01689 [Blumeria hordei DH14]|uniref:Actin-related protein RO7 n=1 Tax=Blumeria graminis f. sp. hordei (strain DH14) TaxID=546991 RepID=N1JCI3_BLUG1|nr:hypothetical protein BGHDH14_bgh01689 [Blumeria hordei DH14]
MFSGSPSYAHRAASIIKSPTGPQTPLRISTPNFGSPSVLRAEEECVVLEFGARYLQVGLAGSATPQAVIDFGCEQLRRAGDLRKWSTNYDGSNRIANGKEWGEAFELWRPDLRNLDLGLVGDKIERAVRDAFTKNLLIDSRPRKFLLALPSTLPIPLLSTTLETLFSNFQPSSISLMSAPLLAAIAAGVRSALVVDIGWAGTTVTSIYEYREVQWNRSIRGSKMLGDALSRKLFSFIYKLPASDYIENSENNLSFEECEEVMERVVWCQAMKKLHSSTLQDPTTQVEKSVSDTLETEEQKYDDIINIPLRSIKPMRTIQIPFSELSSPCESVFFSPDTTATEFDDEELPLHLLVYQSLLKLPVDIRSVCMERIIFVGGASNIPGLKARIMQEVFHLVEKHGWNRVRGNAVEQLIKNPKLYKNQTIRSDPFESQTEINKSIIKSTSVAASTPQEPDPFERRIRKGATKDPSTVKAGTLRAIGTLGAWAGGSLLSQLKIQAVAVIEKEQWSQHGIYGASKQNDSHHTSLWKGMESTNIRSGPGERSSWTLGLWG